MEEKDNKNNEKVQALREMIYSAEKTLQGAKAMLLQLEGKKKVGRKKKSTEENEEDGRIIEGTFDGQVMIGTDGKQYPVPANYASKSKLIEGDMLKLTITPDGSFIYKQIGPTNRKRLIGIASLDADGNYFVAASGKAYKVLLASITYFKVEPGDEVTLVVPNDIDSDWGSIENVLQKRKETSLNNFSKIEDTDKTLDKNNDFLFEDLSITPSKEEKINDEDTLIDEWTPDIEELKRELNSKP